MDDASKVHQRIQIGNILAQLFGLRTSCSTKLDNAIVLHRSPRGAVFFRQRAGAPHQIREAFHLWGSDASDLARTNRTA